MRRFSLRWLDRYRNLGLLFARGIPGVIFLYHGYQRFDGGLNGAFLDSLGVPFPDVMVYVLTFGELIGGIFLILGFMTRLVALAFIVEMILAILLVKIDIGLVVQGAAGAELDLALIAAMAAVATTGPGTLSIDRNAGLEGRAR